MYGGSVFFLMANKWSSMKLVPQKMEGWTAFGFESQAGCTPPEGWGLQFGSTPAPSPAAR